MSSQIRHTKSKKRLVQATFAAIIAVGVTTQSSLVQAEEKMEKCYGIVKKGMNDCAANSHSCQGQAGKDSDPNEWIFVPDGTCKKIVNSSTKPGSEMPK